MAWKEYYIYNLENLSLTAGPGAGAGGVPVPTSIRTDSDADFEMMKRTHIATDSRIFVEYRDDAYGRFLQSGQIDLRTISGTPLFTTAAGLVGIHPNNFLPYILTRPFLIRGSTNFTANFADFSGATNSIRQALHGAKLRTGRAPWDAKWQATPYFDYTIPPGELSMAADASAVFNLNINIDSHFLIRRITATRTGAALITVKDGSTGRQWMNTPVHIDNFAGNSQFPNILPAPRFVRRGSVVNITVQDLSSAANEIRLVFSGEKLY